MQFSLTHLQDPFRCLAGIFFKSLSRFAYHRYSGKSNGKLLLGHRAFIATLKQCRIHSSWPHTAYFRPENCWLKKWLTPWTNEWIMNRWGVCDGETRIKIGPESDTVIFSGIYYYAHLMCPTYNFGTFFPKLYSANFDKNRSWNISKIINIGIFRNSSSYLESYETIEVTARTPLSPNEQTNE